MNLDTNSSISLRWTLRCGEWVLLLMTILLYFLDEASTPDLILKCVAFSTFLFLLSFVFPLKRPLWQRRAYVACEIILIGIALAMEMELSVMLYFLLITAIFR